MRNFSLLLLTSLISSLSYGQISRYSIDINHVNAGSLEEKTEYFSDSIVTTSQIQLEFITLQDSNTYSVKTQFVEDSDGQLIYVDREMKLQDGNPSYQRFFNPQYSLDNPIEMQTLGPQGIRRVSSDSLQETGDSLQFWSYSTEHNQIKRLNRVLLDQKILNAKKLWVVKDSISGLGPIISLMDRNFELLSAAQESAMGYLEIREVQARDSLISLIDLKSQQKTIASNLLLPDPKNINAVELKTTYENGESQTVTLTDNMFHPLPRDSSALAELTASNLWVNSDDLDLFSIADSLTMDLILQLEMAVELTKYCREQDLNNPAFQLLKLARNIDLPSQLVYGYYYQHGKWISGYWTEIGIGDEWQIFHPIQYSPINSSLYLPIAKSGLKNGVLEFFAQPELKKIEVINYLRNGKPVKSTKAKGDYFIRGLGLSFNIPKNFVNQTDSTQLGSNFLLLSDGQNHIQMDYITPPFLNEALMINYLQALSGSSTVSLNSYLPNISYEATNESSTFLAIPQGDSFLLIECSGPDAGELMLMLSKKNLELKK
ncbi:hypothetical protein [Reichenbachiella ulvae]|uniref:GLPGLI family protein n=1 Tax=Reichenbachiella ulvae TaxID=2980104 RepID=A0ABT3CTZ2_9BACT|nr:hypothetical protein [Reichenbachiella ulvae]MCV9387089.1 hypothetical protein [Reichenbachiella ulvae]